LSLAAHRRPIFVTPSSRPIALSPSPSSYPQTPHAADRTNAAAIVGSAFRCRYHRPLCRCQGLRRRYMRRSDVPLCIFVCVDELARDEFCPFGTTCTYSYRRTKIKRCLTMIKNTIVPTRDPKLTALTSVPLRGQQSTRSTSHDEHGTTLTAVCAPWHHSEISVHCTDGIPSQRLNSVGANDAPLS